MLHRTMHVNMVTSGLESAAPAVVASEARPNDEAAESIPHTYHGLWCAFDSTVDTHAAAERSSRVCDEEGAAEERSIRRGLHWARGCRGWGCRGSACAVSLPPNRLAAQTTASARSRMVGWSLWSSRTSLHFTSLGMSLLIAAAARPCLLRLMQLNHHTTARNTTTTEHHSNTHAHHCLSPTSNVRCPAA